MRESPLIVCFSILFYTVNFAQTTCVSYMLAPPPPQHNAVNYNVLFFFLSVTGHWSLLTFIIFWNFCWFRFSPNYKSGFFLRRFTLCLLFHSSWAHPATSSFTLGQIRGACVRISRYWAVARCSALLNVRCSHWCERSCVQNIHLHAEIKIVAQFKTNTINVKQNKN